MNGWPPNSKCVITYVPSWAVRVKWMEQVVVGENVCIWWCGQRTPWGAVMRGFPQLNGYKVQDIGLYSRLGYDGCWPVDWMRPLDGDVTNDDLDVVEMYKDKSKFGLVFPQ
jgi:hypothetical protein